MFSVIIPTYNRLELLKRAIDSVLNQTFQEFEIIVVDDCSSDGTQNWGKRINHKHITYLRNKTNKGLAFNRNHGANNSKYDFLVFLDDDDIWLSNHLSELKKLITLYPNAGLYCNSYIINYGENEVKAIHDNKYLNTTVTKFSNFECFVNKNALCAPSASMIPKKVFDEIGGFNPNISFTEDTYIQVRIALKYPIVYNSNATIIYSQDTGNNMSLTMVNNKNYMDFDKYLVHKKEFPHLKIWLDNIRFYLGQKHLEVGNKGYINFFSKIDRKNLTLDKRIFISLNYGLMKLILKLKN